MEEYWADLKANNAECAQELPAELPKVENDHFIATAPRLLPNQKAISLLTRGFDIKKHMWLYICQPVGTGKTTEMVEIGYLMAIDTIAANGKKTATVRLVVPANEQVQLYERKFKSKLAESSSRIKFIWMTHYEFLQQWEATPEEISKDIVVADEGHMLLIRSVGDKPASAWPKRFVLLSAVTRDQWTGTEALSFQNVIGKQRTAIYVDTT